MKQTHRLILTYEKGKKYDEYMLFDILPEANVKGYINRYLPLVDGKNIGSAYITSTGWNEEHIINLVKV